MESYYTITMLSTVIPPYFRERFRTLNDEELQDTWKKTVINWQQEFLLSLRDGKPCSDWCQKMILYHLVVRESPDFLNTLPSSFWYSKPPQPPQPPPSPSQDHVNQRLLTLEQECRQQRARLAALETEYRQKLLSSSPEASNAVHPPDASPTPFTTPFHSFQQIDPSVVVEELPLVESSNPPVMGTIDPPTDPHPPSVMRF